MSAFNFMTFFTFVLGLCVGSFLNVCISRIPNKQSIVWPGSRCPNCLSPIRFHDNIPLLGYLVLKGRCRDCHEKIALRYPAVELAMGLLSAALFVKFGFSAEFPVYFVFTAALLTLSLIDLDHRILPNVITLPGIPLGFAGSLLVPTVTVMDALLGILVGGGILWLVGAGYQALRGKEGMGGGDVKLLAMIGALLGWQGVFFTIFVGSALGAVGGAAALLLSKDPDRRHIPFGPYLSLGAVIYIFFGARIISWYLGLMR